MMKIGLARRTYRADGGAEKSVNLYIKAIVESGLKAELATSSWLDATHVRFDTCHVPIKGWSRVSKSRSFRRGVNKWAKSGRCDLYQSNEWAPGVDILRLGDGLHSIWLHKLADSERGIGKYLRLLSSFHRDRLKSEEEALLDPRLKKIICNSKYVSQQLNELYPEVGHKVVVLHNPIVRESSGLMTSKEGNQTGIYRLGFAGSGWYRKGLDRLIGALAELPPEFILDVVGQDSNQSKYRQMARDYGVSDRVIFHGAVLQMREFYGSIDLLVHPSRYDPFPNVVIEALSAEIPVVSSCDCGVVDFENYSGVTVYSPQYSRLSDTIVAVVKSGPLSVSKDLFKDFSYRSFQSQLINLYRDLV